MGMLARRDFSQFDSRSSWILLWGGPRIQALGNGARQTVQPCQDWEG